MPERIRTIDIIRMAVLTLALDSFIRALEMLKVLPDDGSTRLVMAIVLLIIAVKVW